MRNRKGFTLLELLLVIVILALLLIIAIPKIIEFISSSRKNSYVDTVHEFVDSIRKDATSEVYEFPIAKSDVTIVSINMVGLEKGGNKSAFNGRWIEDKSYVAIINVGTDIDPVYSYFVTMLDSKRYALPLMLDNKVNTSSIIRNNYSGSPVSITPLCGNKDGKYMVISNIAGLEEYKLSQGWNATVYSNDGC